MTEDASVPPPEPPRPPSWTTRMLDGIEWLGNKLPDPAALFLIALVVTWLLSAILAPVEFTEIDPRTLGKDASGAERKPEPIRVKDQLTGGSLAQFLSRMVKTFTDFPPLGIVLVALLGVGVAEHTGLVNAVMKAIMSFTPTRWLTPMLLLVGILSHLAADSGYVLVIPLGGVIYYAAGRHPLAGIAAAFAAVSGGLSANFLPCGLDPLLQQFTQLAARLIDPTRDVHPLCNLWFTSASCLLIIGVGWYITDCVIEPRLNATAPVDGDPADMPRMEALTPLERRGLYAGLGAVLLCAGLLAAAALPEQSPLRGKNGSLSTAEAPLMQSLIPLIFLFFLVPGVVYGYTARTVHSHRDIVKGMSKSMSTMGYYLVMAFFAAQFTYAFRESNLGALLAIKGAELLKAMDLPPEMTIVGIILLTTVVNLFIGSASAKWAFLGPIFVPMLMQLGISPELTQAAYRIGDSATHIITPLMPYFPLVVVYCQRYVKNTGVGTLVSLMLPYSLTFLVTWTVLLLVYWQLGFSLGLEATYTYP
ncbi:MAG: AbgT family transporter [Gemmataceae bacterium]|nr:AbgT family transporter [Gemmataceae bacterium]